MPHVEISLGTNGHPECLRFQNGSEKIIDDVGGRTMSALVRLVTLTAYERWKSTDSRKCPDLGEGYQEAIASLADAVFNRKNHNETHWLHELFGEHPHIRYLVGARGRNPSVTVSPEVRIDVFDVRGQRMDNLGGLRRILGIKDDIGSGRGQPETIEINLNLGRDRKTGELCISSVDPKGYLTTNDNVYLTVTSNFSSNLTVFWCAPDSQISFLYPVLEIDDVDVEVSPRLKGIFIGIGNDDPIVVYDPRGAHIIFALAGTYEIQPSDCETIRLAVANVVPAIFLRRVPAVPRFECHYLDHANGDGDRGIGGAPPLPNWEKELARELSKFADTLYLFIIPHR